jgi:WbqC-like protein
MKKIAIVQSCYIPWKGYFDLIAQADEFIFLDDAQYTRRDWRNRNRIKSPHGTKWLTVPVETKGQYLSRIEVINGHGMKWSEKHWKSIRHAYSKAPAFKAYGPWVESLYQKVCSKNLSRINFGFIEEICRLLEISTPLSWSTDYGESRLARTERLVELCRRAEAKEYLSGPSAMAYLEEERFQDAGIKVSYIDYEGYPEYPQLHPPFEHEVTILDLILSVGSDAPKFMRHTP